MVCVPDASGARTSLKVPASCMMITPLFFGEWGMQDKFSCDPCHLLTDRLMFPGSGTTYERCRTAWGFLKGRGDERVYVNAALPPAGNRLR